MYNIEKLKAYIRNVFSYTDKAHDYLHSFRVYENAKEIMGDYNNAIEEIVVISALLHDVSDDKLFKDESNIDKWFNMYPSKYEREIRNTISEIRWSKGIRPTTIESMIVQDADRIDALGAIGIARVFTYGGYIGRPIYSESLESSMDHFEEKLFKLKNNMNTKRGKEMAEKRESFMRLFVNTLYDEVEGRS